MTELERCIPETLKKLYLYDDEHKGELITTLQMYLRNNQSIRKLQVQCLCIIERYLTGLKK